MIPFDPSRPQNLTQCIAGEPRLQKLINDDPRVKKLTDLSLKLEGLNRNVATHAAGVVIADRKLTEVVPLYKDVSSNLLLPSTQFDMYSAENAGLVKFDFLGLKTLTVINNTHKLIRKKIEDFDIDFCEDKRDQVFEYLTTKYKDSVAHIITFGKLKARMVIRDVGRVLGLPYGFVDSISKMIPFDPSRPQNLTQCIAGEPRLQKLINDDPRVKKLTDLSLKLEGLNRNVATHAAGVVIADKKLTEVVPLYKDVSADLLLPSTQFDMYSAENAGLVKFDFLGLKTLTVINNTQKLVRKKIKDFHIDKISYEDQKVFDLMSTGKTVGLFQIESAGMREALIQMKPNHIEDIIALVALYSPGPMSNIQTYNDCKHGKQTPDYLHPLLEEILKPTYGVIIYQEQVMQIAQKLSGFTAGQADLLRRAMGKKKRAELEKQKHGFINGAVKNGIAKDVAAGIFLKIEPFAEYGFNKSHAAAYAVSYTHLTLPTITEV